MVRSKYNAHKTIVDGIKFDSAKEAKRYRELMFLFKTGEIDNLKLQPKYRLVESYINGKGKSIRGIDYIADFQYMKDGKVVIEDVKGYKTQTYKLKKKLFESKYNPLTITEI